MRETRVPEQRCMECLVAFVSVGRRLWRRRLGAVGQTAHPTLYEFTVVRAAGHS